MYDIVRNNSPNVYNSKLVTHRNHTCDVEKVGTMRILVLRFCHVPQIETHMCAHDKHVGVGRVGGGGADVNK